MALQSNLDRRKGSWWAIWIQLTVAICLLATPVMSESRTAADYYVHSLPGQPDGPLLKMHAGHVEITPEHNGHLFFWLFHNRHIGDRQRTVIWLNGGPGCSSMDGALMELGPYRVRKEGKLEYNEGSWDEFANVLFVDNPVGTGFSYVNTDSYLHELQEMADQFVIFLEKWFKLFPQFEHDDLYFAGESYAGQHIPYIAKTILDRNKKAARQGIREWNVKGLLIGNGWIAPAEHYQSYLPFAYAEGLLQGGSPDAQKVEVQMSACLADLSKPNADEKVDLSSCEAILTSILSVTKKDNMCYNMYDVRLKDKWSSCGMNWPPDLEDVTPYLRRDDVKAALHINPDKRTGWTECNGAVGAAFRASHSKPSIKILPDLLESGLPITLFSGNKDFICNHIGTEDFINNMKWSGGQGFELSPGVWAPKRAWTFEGEAAGYYQEARNLTYVLFYNASHMVPFDYPRRTRDMIDRFMGVDIASIGGKPADSRIDGEKAGSETSVGGHPNSTAAIEEGEQKVHEATLKAYYRSGEAALVIVAFAATLFGLWVWRGRRKARGQGYISVPLANGNVSGGLGKSRTQDLEAGDFDENELDDLSTSQRRRPNGYTDDVPAEEIGGRGRAVTELAAEPYDLASDSDEDSDDAGDRPRSKGKQGR